MSDLSSRILVEGSAEHDRRMTTTWPGMTASGQPGDRFDDIRLTYG